MESENNFAQISGVFSKQFEYSHTCCGEKFYNAVVDVKRESGTIDHVPVKASEYALITGETSDKPYIVCGSFRSFNKHDAETGKAKLELFLFADDIIPCADDTDSSRSLNNVNLVGYITKKPVFRETPKKRQITDILIAVNRQYGKTDYIPCVIWGRNARYAKRLEVGSKVRLAGRIQSRDYVKWVETENPDVKKPEVRTAYELSVSKIEKINKEDE